MFCCLNLYRTTRISERFPRWAWLSSRRGAGHTCAPSAHNQSQYLRSSCSSLSSPDCLLLSDGSVCAPCRYLNVLPLLCCPCCLQVTLAWAQNPLCYLFRSPGPSLPFFVPCRGSCLNLTFSSARACPPGLPGLSDQCSPFPSKLSRATPTNTPAQLSADPGGSTEMPVLSLRSPDAPNICVVKL